MVTVRYSKKENDFVIHWTKDHQCNAGFILDVITEPYFLDELQNRGYDVDTLRFSIKKLNVDKNAPTEEGEIKP
jgi:hypothetical protein